MIDFWCMPQKFGISISNALKANTFAKLVLEITDLIYRTYHYSTKSRQELKEISEQLDVKVHMPTQVKGTRWIPHVEKALGVLLVGSKTSQPATDAGQHASVLTHMEHLAEGHTQFRYQGQG